MTLNALKSHVRFTIDIPNIPINSILPLEGTFQPHLITIIILPSNHTNYYLC